MSTQNDVVTNLINAEKALKAGDKRGASILIDQVLKSDFTNRHAWQLLHKMLDPNEPLDSFQIKFTKKYFPDKLHLLIDASSRVENGQSQITNSRVQGDIQPKPQSLKIPSKKENNESSKSNPGKQDPNILPQNTQKIEVTTHIKNIISHNPIILLFVGLGVLLCSFLLCGLVAFFWFRNPSTYLPKGLTPGIWIRANTNDIPAVSSGPWTSISGYLGYELMLPLKDRPDCIYKDISKCELTDDKTLKITISGSSVSLRVISYFGDTVTLMDLGTGTEIEFKKITGDSSSGNLEKDILGRWGARIQPSFSTDAFFKPNISFEFKTNNKLVTNLLASDESTTYETKYWIDNNILNIQTVGDNPQIINVEIMEDFGDYLIATYDQQQGYYPRFIFIRVK